MIARNIILILLTLGFTVMLFEKGITGAILGGPEISPVSIASGEPIGQMLNYTYQVIPDVLQNNSEMQDSANSGNAGNSSPSDSGNLTVSGNSANIGSSGFAGSSGSGSGSHASSSSNNNGIGIQSTDGSIPFDLRIGDQDEYYSNGVSATWTAKNMLPGQKYDFYIPFVRLAKPPECAHGGHTEITANYSVIEETPCVESDTDCYTDAHPDEMANDVVLTRCTYRGDRYCIDCLSGEMRAAYNPLNGVCSGYVMQTNADWKVRDLNEDGKQSFYDLKNAPLDNLPSLTSLSTPRFEMGVKFDESAGNNFQGDAFNLTMTFTINEDVSQ